MPINTYSVSENKHSGLFLIIYIHSIESCSGKTVKKQLTRRIVIFELFIEFPRVGQYDETNAPISFTNDDSKTKHLCVSGGSDLDNVIVNSVSTGSTHTDSI